MSADSNAALIAALTPIVGSSYVRAVGPDTIDLRPTVIVDDQAPRVVVYPTSIQQLSQLMSYCHDQSLAVIPVGGGTQLSLGELPDRYDVAVCLEQLNQIVAHEPDDMTVTVQAGVTLAALQDHLSRAGQVLPLDPPLPSTATVGGVIATRDAGPVQLAFRGMSDHLLGIKVVDSRGVVTKAGGRVVKNVSGYEMGRIYTGSLGTLAIIVEATFKVRPQLEKGAALVVQVQDFKHADQVIERLLHSDAEPTMLELLGPRPLTIVAGYTGTDDQVAWQLGEASRRIQEIGPDRASSDDQDGWIKQLPWSAAHPLVLRAHRHDASPAVFPGIVDDYVSSGAHDGPYDDARVIAHNRTQTPADDQGASNDPSNPVGTSNPVVTCTVSLLVTQQGRYLQEICEGTLSQGVSVALACHAGSGIVQLHLLSNDEAALDHGEVISIVERWRATAERLNGQLIVKSAPTKVKEALSVWGPPRQDFFLHRAIKEKMDPKRILNPGRFIGKI